MTRRIPVPAGKYPPAGGRALFEFEDKSLALFNIDGELFAIDDSCPHQGSSLCGGKLEGRVISCGAHGLRFNLQSGYLLNSTQVKVNNYPVEIIDGQAFIVLVSEETAP
jgi:nitrite reductase/ring-hydroxylating ferredoxin subunit